MHGIAECWAAVRRTAAREPGLARAQTLPETKEQPSRGLKPLVLVVDDFEDAREMLREFLKGVGYRAVEAASGYEALEKANRLDPAIILLDLAMPGMSGFEVARRLRADGRTRSTPIIAITGHAVWTYENEAREAGCDSFLTKPLHAQDLQAEIRRLLKHRGESPE
jgi:two-component system, cell cycle response regulator DivK